MHKCSSISDGETAGAAVHTKHSVITRAIRAASCISSCFILHVPLLFLVYLKRNFRHSNACHFIERSWVEKSWIHFSFSESSSSCIQARAIASVIFHSWVWKCLSLCLSLTQASKPGLLCFWLNISSFAATCFPISSAQDILPRVQSLHWGKSKNVNRPHFSWWVGKR